MGLSTGTVVAQTDPVRSRPEDSLIGAALNLAARLQALAAPGEIVIDGPTQRLIGRRFETRSLGLKSLKGFARPIEVFVVEAAAEQASRLTYRLATVQTPFVNRTRERSHLNALVEQAVAGDAQVVSLVGEAGIGKSRLANSVREHGIGLGCHAITLQCSPALVNTALSPHVDHLRQACGIRTADNPALQVLKVRMVLDRLAVDDPDALAILADLLGIPSTAAPPLAMSPPSRRRGPSRSSGSSCSSRHGARRC